MDYIFALYLFVISAIGLCFAAYCLVRWEHDKEMFKISVLSLVTFFLTAFMGATLLTAVS